MVNVKGESTVNGGKCTTERTSPRPRTITLVVQVFEGANVTIQGSDPFFSVIHLSPLSVGLPLIFTALVMFFTDHYQYTVW